MQKLFGTDGVRGIANLEPMTGETMMKLGRIVAYAFKGRAGHHQIVIGKDTRLSGYMLQSALLSGICSMGVDVLLVGPMPSPGVAFLTRSLRADAGVMISASHNPYQDNGVKFFSHDGFKLPDELELRIEELLLSNEIEHLRPTADEIGKAFRVVDAEGCYIEFVKRSLPRDMDFRVTRECKGGNFRSTIYSRMLPGIRLALPLYLLPRRRTASQHNTLEGDLRPPQSGRRRRPDCEGPADENRACAPVGRRGCTPRRRCRPVGSFRVGNYACSVRCSPDPRQGCTGARNCDRSGRVRPAVLLTRFEAGVTLTAT